MTECRIGSLPWFAGVFWLGVSTLTYGAARALFWLGDGPGRRWVWRGAWVLIHATAFANEAGIACAVEGGASDDEGRSDA